MDGFASLLVNRKLFLGKRRTQNCSKAVVYNDRSFLYTNEYQHIYNLQVNMKTFPLADRTTSTDTTILAKLEINVTYGLSILGSLFSVAMLVYTAVALGSKNGAFDNLRTQGIDNRRPITVTNESDKECVDDCTRYWMVLLVISCGFFVTLALTVYLSSVLKGFYDCAHYITLIPVSQPRVNSNGIPPLCNGNGPLTYTEPRIFQEDLERSRRQFSPISVKRYNLDPINFSNALNLPSLNSSPQSWDPQASPSRFSVSDDIIMTDEFSQTCLPLSRDHFLPRKSSSEGATSLQIACGHVSDSQSISSNLDEFIMMNHATRL